MLAAKLETRNLSENAEPSTKPFRHQSFHSATFVATFLKVCSCLFGPAKCTHPFPSPPLEGEGKTELAPVPLEGDGIILFYLAFARLKERFRLSFRIFETVFS